MGWGLDVEWADLRREGVQLGIVDFVTVRYLARPGRAYPQGPELARLERALRKRGVRSIRELQATLAVWRPWQSEPPWQPSLSPTS